MSKDIGARLRAVRQSHGLSQRELARRAGLTNGLVSLIEMNRVSPSVSSLKKLLDSLPMSLAEFFGAETATTPPTFYSAQELPEIGTAEHSRRLLAAARVGRAMAIVHERYAAGAVGSATESAGGEQGGFVIRGKLEVTVGGVSRVLGPGDAYYFSSSAPHHFRNAGREVCELISASTLPTF